MYLFSFFFFLWYTTQVVFATMLLKKSFKYPNCSERQSSFLVSPRIRTECVFAHESLVVTEFDSWTKRASVRVMQLPHPPRLPPIDLFHGPEKKRPRPSKEICHKVERQLRQRILWQRRKQFVENASTNNLNSNNNNNATTSKESQLLVAPGGLSSITSSSSVAIDSSLPTSPPSPDFSFCRSRNPINADKAKKKKDKVKAGVYRWLLSQFDKIVPLKIYHPPGHQDRHGDDPQISLSSSSNLEGCPSSVSLRYELARRPCFTESNFTL